MTIEDRIKLCISKHPDWDERRLASAVRGSSLAGIRAIRAGEPMPERAQEPPRPACDPGTVTLDSVRARYDIIAIIRDYVAGLKRGVLKLEREVCQQTAGKDAARFRRAIENNADEFRAFRVKLKLDQEHAEGAWYWGNRETVAEAVKLRDSV